MNYPTTYERYHVYTSTDTLPTVCESLEIALQLVSSFAAGTIAHVERVVEMHTVYQVYGTAIMPLPAAPLPAVSTQSNQITHVRKA